MTQRPSVAAVRSRPYDSEQQPLCPDALSPSPYVQAWPEANHGIMEYVPGSQPKTVRRPSNLRGIRDSWLTRRAVVLFFSNCDPVRKDTCVHMPCCLSARSCGFNQIK